MATKLDISQLDFDGIKDNLKTFLTQQDEFTDYDFEGAGMNILLDTLAYNTHYLAYNANMLANEMYLDSADQRSSVVSLAKQVGPKEAALVKKFDKEDAGKKYKENIRPFEDLFLELGSIIMKNAFNFLAANPSGEAQRLRKEIETQASKIKKTGGVEQIKKVEAELARLSRIGGIESIFPTEGIVFKYKGKIYKLTGTFAAINQLMGIIKFGR